MGGSGYNTSLSVGRSVRRDASSRTPIWFWLDGPFYVIDMGCGPEDKPHEYRSRTPLLTTEDDPDGLVVWCGQCLMFQYLEKAKLHPVLNEVMESRQAKGKGPLSELEVARLRRAVNVTLVKEPDTPILLPPEDSFIETKGTYRGHLQGVSITQDNNVLRERVGQELQNRGFVHTDAEIMEIAVQFGLPVAEVRKINAGLAGSDSGAAGQVEMCRANLHVMSLDNIYVSEAKRKCRQCRNIAQNKRRAAARMSKAA